MANFSFRHKSDYLRNEHSNSQNFFFLPCLKGANLEENLDLLTQLFLIKPVKGDKY